MSRLFNKYEERERHKITTWETWGSSQMRGSKSILRSSLKRLCIIVTDIPHSFHSFFGSCCTWARRIIRHWCHSSSFDTFLQVELRLFSIQNILKKRNNCKLEKGNSKRFNLRGRKKLYRFQIPFTHFSLFPLNSVNMKICNKWEKTEPSMIFFLSFS